MAEETWFCKNLDSIPICPEQDGCSELYYNNTNRKNTYYMGVCDANESNTCLTDEMRTQLAYQSCQRAMDVEVYREKREIDVVYDERKNRHKIDKLLEKEMVSYEVLKGGSGELFYVQIGADDEYIHMKRLCDAREIVSNIMRSNGCKVRESLHIAWYGNEEGVCFRLGAEGISTQKFCRVMKAHGMSFRLSRRCEAEVMDALLHYLLGNAKTIEIPSKKGWTRMLDGRLHFAKKGETTMSEVWENAI